MSNKLAIFALIIGSLLNLSVNAIEVNQEEAIFAMGCFWCAESEFREHETNALLPGIFSIKVGYAGGVKSNPTYADHEGYKEAVKIIYNPNVIPYNKLLDIFWHNIDPFDALGQFCDKGSPYTSVIFFKNDSQKKLSYEFKENIEKTLKKKIVTEIILYTTFYDAEEYHQNYKAKNPVRYNYYRWNCGRDARLKSIWNES